MRKLILTSVTFKTGENEYQEQFLAWINGTEDESKDFWTACAQVEHWFKTSGRYPESNLLSVIAHPTIGPEYGPTVKISGDFGAPHSCKNEFPPRIEPEGSMSIDVAIDCNGRKKDWMFGFYDFDDKLWRLTQPDYDESFEIDHAVWFLPPQPESIA